MNQPANAIKVLRKPYIDNIRWLCVIMLFPYHILMIYNSWGEGFYIKGEDIKATSTFLYITWPWFMPLLFTIAGISVSLRTVRIAVC